MIDSISENLEPELPLQSGDGGLAEVPDPEAYSQKQIEDGLRAICTSWLSKIKQSKRHKKPFDDDAREAMNFFDGSNNWFWRDQGVDYSRMGPPSFRMQINKVFEAVKLFGSVIYHRNPVRTVTAKKFPIVSPESLNINPEPPPPDPAGMQAPPDPRLEQYMQISAQVSKAETTRKTVSEVIASYLNYTPNELDLKENAR